MNIVEPFIRQALSFPERPAVAVAGKTLTYGELHEAVRRLAAGFDAAGVRRGDRVAVRGAFFPLVTATLALAWIGAVSVEAPGEPEVIVPVLQKLEVKFVFHPGADGSRIEVPGVGPSLSLSSVLRRVAADQAVAVADVLPDESWRIALSSGTTGQPKGILYSHERTLTNVNLLRTVYPAGPGDRVLICMTAGMSFAVYNWLRCLVNGACAVFPKPFSSDAILRVLHEDAITHAMVTPGIAGELATLARDARDGPLGTPPLALRILSVGGARVAPQVRELLRTHVCPELYLHYGATEAHLLAVLDSSMQRTYPYSAGRLLPWVEAQAVGPDGQPVAHGEAGRLRLRTPTLALGYVGGDPADGQAFRDGWFYSNDVGTVSSNGIVRLTGRSNDVINIDGIKLDPEALEAVIQQDPDITECAVVDVPDALGQPVLAVVLVAAHRQIDLGALRQRCKASGVGAPIRIVTYADKLPRNESGKIMRGVVRKNMTQSDVVVAPRQAANA